MLMLLAVSVLILCLLAVLMAITTLGKVAVIVIAGLAALFAVAYMLGYGPGIPARGGPARYT